VAGRAEAALERHFWVVVLLLAMVMAAAQITSALGETATWDEPVHLAAGYSYLTTGSFEMSLEHPPLARMLLALPAYLVQRPANGIPSDWDRRQLELTANLFLYRNSVAPESLLMAARSVNIVLTAAFAVYLAWWTRRRFGSGAALFATGLFAFDPNITAHGRYVTTDLAAAFLIFAATTLWVEYLLERRWRWLLLTGVALGAACSTKYSTLYLGPLLLTLFWLQPNPFRPPLARVREVRRHLGRPDFRGVVDRVLARGAPRRPTPRVGAQDHADGPDRTRAVVSCRYPSHEGVLVSDRVGPHGRIRCGGTAELSAGHSS
jgi:hypothetical protein